MDTKLIKNLVQGGSKSFTVSDAGAWYRLGYVEKNVDFFGEFLILHSWNSNCPNISKLLIGGAIMGTSRPSFSIKELFSSFAGSAAGTTYIKNKIIKKARVVHGSPGTSSNIYIDIFVQNTSTEFTQKANTWTYKLSTELNPHSCKWVDCAFGDATIPSGFTVEEFSL